MKVLVINAGSSSLKYQLIDMDTKEALAVGLCERIGIDGGYISQKQNGAKVEKQMPFPTHLEAFDALKDMLTSGESKVISSLDEIGAVGHRVVHGGEKFTVSTVITDDVLKGIEELSSLAPLHNPANAIAIRACMKAMSPNVKHVAVFDTSFHQTMPERAFLYGTPYEYYTEYGIRRYGFHGTSHRYISERYAEIVKKDIKDLKIITCHLGNGSSIAAVNGGKSVDTSMGFTPLAGVMMGTRSGDIDSSIIPFLVDNHGKKIDDIMADLNKKSGFLGISGVSSDARDIENAMADGNKRAALVPEMFSYQVKKFIGAYAAAMNGVDAVLFTGGIGENDVNTRGLICKDLEFFGIKIDEELNGKTRGKETNLSAPGATTETWIVPTNEELMIALDTVSLL